MHEKPNPMERWWVMVGIAGPVEELVRGECSPDAGSREYVVVMSWMEMKLTELEGGAQ